MSAKACRNCSATDRYSKEIDARGGYGPNLLPIGFWSEAKFKIEVCGSCGLIEWFVPDRLLPKVKEKLDRVQ
jgi:predicted nucleic-acid-binding Zn-ribbon protein